MIKQLTMLIFIVSGVFWQCADEDGEGEGGGSPRYPAKARFQSTSLALTGHTNLSSSSCPNGSFCLTPSDVSGVVMAVGFIAGVLGEQAGFFVNPIGPNDPSTAEAGSGSEAFSLSESTELNGEYVCCGGSYPQGTEVVARNFQIYFDYIDTTFALTEGPLSGSHTIRIMYTNKTLADGTPAEKGDKLYKSGDSFYFCDGVTCDHATRPADLLMEQIVAQRSGANPEYAFFKVNIDEPFSFTKAEAEAGNWLFSLDFDVSNGAVFSADPTTFTSIHDLVDAFSVNSRPGDGEDGRSGFQVSAQKYAVE